ncbi:MAG TPA: MFS transporter [Actinomycetota bacterium]
MSAPPAEPGRRWASTWAIVAVALALLLLLGWRFLADPSLSAPTRDPAWYTWRAQVVMEADPGSVASPAWGPTGLFAGGYRVTTLVSGALLQRVAGIDSYSFSAFLMLGLPILTGLALAAGAFRSRRDGLVIPLTIAATVALFLTTPYVGYLDNITVLFLLCLLFPFLGAARTSWGARTALFLIGIAAAFTHPTTCVLFGLTMLAVFGFHFLTARWRLSKALQADGPSLMSVGAGMVAGLACWVVGIWGEPASLADAALPPPYTKVFFLDRLWEWIVSLQPWFTVPMMAIAIVSTILLSKRTQRPADAYDVHAAWWLFPFLGIATLVLGESYQYAGDPGSPVVPYYRFMNASAAPMALVGLGLFVAVRWLWKGRGARLAAGAIGALVLVGYLGFMLVQGTGEKNWVSEKTQWANQDVRTSLAAVNRVVAAAGEDRPNVLVVNFGDTDDPTERTNTGYGWAKTYTNVFRTGLPGDAAERSVTYFGSLEHFLAGEPTTSTAGSRGYDNTSAIHYCEAFGWDEEICDEVPEDFVPRFEAFPEEPVVFMIGQYYGGLCNGTPNCTEEEQQAVLDAAMSQGIEVGPDVVVIQGDGLWTPSDEVVAEAQAAAAATAATFEDHPAFYENPLHTLRVLLGLLVLLVLPGLFAMRFFEIGDSPIARIALVPGMSVVLSMLSAIAVLAVWRGPMDTTKGWVIAGVAVGLGAVLGAARTAIVKPLDAFAGYFDRLFGQFSNFDFSVLMGVQYLAQMGQGVVQGAIAKSLAFGGEKGFDVQNLPSARYLLIVVLALYGPYTLVSPFVGVFIDRFPRRRVVWWATLITAGLAVLVALFVLRPLGSETTEGDAFATGGLILGLLAVQACVRVVLAVKSAALPDVLSGKDLLQGNGLSQAGGALFQVVGIAIGTVAAGILSPMVPVALGAAVFVVVAFVGMRLRHAEVHEHVATFGREVSQVLKSIWAGLKEVAGRPPAAMGLASFQMLRYQFWGFVLFVFGLYGSDLAKGGDADTISLVLSGVGGLLGGVLGLLVAQRVKDRIAPARLMVASMFALGAGTILGGILLSLPGFAIMLFVGFFTFFLGKISADTIMQQSMPDDFRGRAFALFDIAYNLGFIIPALILYFVWEDDASTTRTILLVSGAVFLVLTAFVASWARKIRGQLAPQDDLVGEEAAEIAEIAGPESWPRS